MMHYDIDHPKAVQAGPAGFALFLVAMLMVSYFGTGCWPV